MVTGNRLVNVDALHGIARLIYLQAMGNQYKPENENQTKIVLRACLAADAHYKSRQDTQNAKTVILA